MVVASKCFYASAEQVARVRLDLLVTRCEAGAAVGYLQLVNTAGTKVGSPLVFSDGSTTFDAGSRFSDRVFTLPATLPVGGGEYFVSLFLVAGTPGEWEGLARLVPYGLWGWENYLLTTQATMQAIEGELFNEAVVLGTIDYAQAIANACMDLRTRLATADLDPDQVWCDGVVQGVTDTTVTPNTTDTPSGIGARVVPQLVLAATYGALANVFVAQTGYKDGRLADKGVYYRELYDEAMRGSIRALLPLNKNGDYLLTKQESRPRRSLRLVR
jgi:hypothetical protein